MAVDHGSNSVISVDGTDMSSFTDNVSVSRGVDTSDTSSFGDDDHTFIAGLKQGTFTLSGNFETAANTALIGSMDGAVVELIYGPSGITAGNVKYTANCLVTDVGIDSTVTDKVTWSASFVRSGALVDSTY